MRFRVFFWFVLPSVVMMVAFIAAPLVMVFINSVQVTQPVMEQVEIESCTPGFSGETCTTSTETRPTLDEDGNVITQTRYVGFQSYARLMEPAQAFAAVTTGKIGQFLQIDFWGALRFTLTFTLLTLPLIVIVGLSIAISVNNAVQRLRGSVIFVSLLPFIITPVIGSLSIYWLFVGDGILTRAIEGWTGQDIAVFANGWSIEVLMLFYRVWHVSPFAFVIFYAALQTVNQDTLESAIVDGASRWQRLRYVIIPHLMPLIVFVALIHLMDAYRVFDEIVGFRAAGYVQSLQYLTYELMQPDDAGNRQISRASASAVLTMIGIVLLLVPLLRRTWREHRGTS